MDTELPEYNDARAELLAHLAINPHLLIPCGFDEIRIDPKAAEESLSFASKAFADSQAGFSPSEKGFFAFCAGIRCRATASGVWYSYGGLRRQVLGFRSQYAGGLEFLLREIIAACRKAISEPVNLAVLTLPNLWRPPDYYPRIELIETTSSLVRALQANKIDYGSLTWRQFEEVVAEVLKDRGLSVECFCLPLFGSRSRHHSGGGTLEEI